MMTAPSMNRSMRLSQLLSGYAELPARYDCQVQGLSLDSRSIQPGMVFVALGGTRAHGLEYIQDAIGRGAVAVLLEQEGDAPEQQIGIPCIGIEGLRDKIGDLAARFYAEPSRHMAVIGITGTNGKTSVSRFLAQALNAEGPSAVVGTLGNGLLGRESFATHTTPDAITLQALLAVMLEEGARSVAMEVSSHGLDQGRVNGVYFDSVVFTNLSRDHLDYHGDMAAYAAAKARLFHWHGLRHAVINLDDPFGEELMNGLDASVEAVAYGTRARALPERAQWLWATEIATTAAGFEVSIDSSWGEGRFHLPLLGRFNISNALAVLATLLVRGIALNEGLACMARLQPVAGRMQVFGGGEQPLVVVDYAHTPDALQQVLTSLREHCRGRLWVVFGCGGDRDAGKRPQMGEIAKSYADSVVITNDNPRSEAPESIAAEIIAGSGEEGVVVILERRAAIEHAIGQAEADDVVLVAGKGHEDYQLIGAQRLHFDDREAVTECLARSRTSGAD